MIALTENNVDVTDIVIVRYYNLKIDSYVPSPSVNFDIHTQNYKLVFPFEALQENTLKMVYFYVITLLAVIVSVSTSTTSGNDGSDICLSTSSLNKV